MAQANPAAALRALPIRRVILALLLAAVVGATGCSDTEEGLGEDLAVKLTDGPGLKEFPCFSPDGSEIAYSVSTSEREYDYSIHVVPTVGGEPRDLIPDGIPQVCLSWASDGQALYTLNIWDSSLRLVGLDGEIRSRYPSDGLAEPVAVSPGGDWFLYRRLVADNMDMGLRRAGKSGLKFLAETPEWEVDGCFGPGDQMTVVQRPNGGAETSEIAVWSPETREYTRMLLPGTRKIDPGWAADGSVLAYASDESGDFDIWVHDRESLRSVRVTSGPADDRFPSWSRDGTRLAFCRWTVVSHVFVKNLETDEDHQLTRGGSRDRFPVLSPDGRWVVFARTQAPADLPRSPALWVASTAGGSIRHLNTGSLSLYLEQGGVGWSPPSQEVAFSADDGEGNIDIYRASLDGSPPARVTIRRGTDFDPAWSPDGTCIAYTRGVDNGREAEIWAIPATGGMPDRISASAGFNGGAVWAPDSDRLAYFSHAGEAGGGADLWVASRSNPGSSRLILKDGSLNIPVAWSEDGREIIVRKQNRESVTLWAVSVEEDRQVEIGDVPDESESERDLVRLNSAGRKYHSLLHPGGWHAFAEGEDVGDIYVIEISSLLRAEF